MFVGVKQGNGPVTFKISETLRQKALTHAINAQNAIAVQRKQSDNSAEIDLSAYLIKENADLFKAIKQEIKVLLDVDIQVARVHHYSAEQQFGEHVDDAYPGNNTYIVRLDNADNNRLVVNKALLKESGGVGYCLPEHTPHAINSGHSNRYSLVMWGR